MADMAWLDEFFATRNPACDRILLRALTETFLDFVRGSSGGLDWGPRMEHRCYELLNAVLSTMEPVAARSDSGGPYRTPGALTCTRCGQQMAESQSNITESGAVCDRCFGGG